MVKKVRFLLLPFFCIYFFCSDLSRCSARGVLITTTITSLYHSHTWGGGGEGEYARGNPYPYPSISLGEAGNPLYTPLEK